MFNRRQFLVAASALPLSACKVRTINYFPVQDATVRFLNVLVGPPVLDVIQDGTPAWTGIAFESSTGYVSYTAQQTTFNLQVPGSTSTLASVGAPLAGKQPYTLIGFGTLSTPLAILLGDSTLTVPAGNTQVRLFDAAVGQQNIDFYLTAPGVPIETVNPQFGNITYQNSSVFIQVASGEYQVRLTVTNTKVVVYDSGPRIFPDQTATDLVFYSRGSALLPNMYLLDANGPVLQQVIVDNTLARFKVVNLAFQTGTVNSLVDGLPANSTIQYGTGSIYNIVTQGSHVISFESAAVPGATIASVTTTLVPATDSTVFVSGFAGSTIAVALVDNNVPPATGNGRFRMINGSPDSPPFDVFANDVKVASALAYTKSSPYTEIEGNILTLRFVDPATGATLATIPNVALGVGTVLSIYASGPVAQLAVVVVQDNILTTGS